MIFGSFAGLQNLSNMESKCEGREAHFFLQDLIHVMKVGKVASP